MTWGGGGGSRKSSNVIRGDHFSEGGIGYISPCLTPDPPPLPPHPLDERKGRWLVEQHFHGNFWVKVTRFFFCLFLRPP